MNQYDDTLARYNAVVLAICGALSGAMAVIIVSNGGLIGKEIGPGPLYSTLPLSFFQIGQAAAVMPAALLMAAIGRRKGFVLGGLFAVVGALIAIYSGYLSNFWLFLFAVLLIGMSTGSAQHFRFTAVDTASPAFKPKAISWVMVGGIFSGIIGPQVALFTANIFYPIPYFGIFAGLLGIACLMILILYFFLQEPPRKEEAEQTGGRSLRELLGQSRLCVAILSGGTAYGLMAFTMTAAPLAMRDYGLSYHHAILGIQWHVLGMFAPSLITGSLIVKYGLERIMIIGFLALMASAAVALMGTSLWHFWISLILLGVGWNFGFIGATTMVTECHTDSEKGRAQGINELSVFSIVVISTFMAGVTFSQVGWEMMNVIFFPICLAIIFMIYKSKQAT